MDVLAQHVARDASTPRGGAILPGGVVLADLLERPVADARALAAAPMVAAAT
ncbi:MAG TPA: hypothetical protein PKA64_10700 [Myxococcota bacterium]|nr:hypothetical protein [Myxococcota bacterium]